MPPKAVAMLANETGSSVVMFFESSTVREAEQIVALSGGSIAEIAPFTIVTSNESVLRRMKSEREPLSLFEPYALLSDTYGQDAPWVYLRTGSGTAVPADGSRSLLASYMLAKGDYAGISHTVQPYIGVVTDRFSRDAIDRPAIDVRLPGASVVMETTDNDVFLKDVFHEHLSKSGRETTTALLQTFVLDLIGDDVSFEHDVSPLLGDAVMELKPTEEGKVFVAISGRVLNEEVLQRSVDRLHSSLRARASAAEIQERLFDDRFTYRAIGGVRREGASTQITQGKWNVTITRLGDSLFISALDGDRFVLSNAEETIGALQSEQPLPFLERQSVNGSSVIAGGGVSDAHLRSILAVILGTTELLPQQDAEPFEWTIRREGSLLLLLTQKASSFPLATGIEER